MAVHSASKSSAKAIVGVLGASGYTGSELVRLLLRHPHVEPLAGFGFGNFVFCDHRAFTANFFGQRVESRQKLCFQVPSGHWYCVPVQRPLFELCRQSTTATINRLDRRKKEPRHAQSTPHSRR